MIRELSEVVFNVSRPMIPMLHRVGLRDPDRLPANQNMIVQPEELEGLIKAAVRAKWAFVSMDELQETCLGKAACGRLMAFTLDDGYLDNLTHAQPVFEAFRVPFCVYVTTAFPGDRVRPWWYLLEDVLLAHSSIDLPDGATVVAETLEQKDALFMRLRRHFMSDPEQSRAAMAWLTGLLPEAGSATAQTLFLDWDQIRAVARSPLGTIGAHTHTHPALAQQPAAEVREEVFGSRDRLHEQTGEVPRHFAYPYGGRNEVSVAVRETVRAAGFGTAVSTRFGVVGRGVDPLDVPRVFFGPGQTLSGLGREVRRRAWRSQVKRFLGMAN